MNKLGILILVGLKANFGLSILYHRTFKEKKDRWVLLIIGLCFAAVVPMFYGFVYLIRAIYFALDPIGQERALLNLGILSGQFIILIFGIYYVISAFYFAKDLDMLIPLPIRAYAVMVSKFVIIMVNEYLTVAAVVLPVLITFGVLAESGAGYWVNAALVYLTLPILPLAVVSILVVAMMRFINISRKKDLFILIGGIVLLCVTFGIQLLIHRAADEDVSVQNIAAFLSSPNSLLNRLGAYFPPSIWATRAIAGGFSGEGFIHLFIFLGASLLLLGSMIILSERLFYKGAIGLVESPGRKRMLTNEELSRYVSSGRHAVAAIFIREWRLMNRTPVFLLNGVLMGIILPVFFMLVARLNSGSMGLSLEQLVTSENSLIIILLMALFMVACSRINGISSSTFSREGQQFWISRIIPVAPQEQIAAKFLHSYLIGMLGAGAALVVAVVVLHPGIVDLVIALALALVVCILLTALGMMIDLARPLLDWTNPQKAIKQNLNVLLAMLADVGILTAAYFGIKAMIKAGVTTQFILWALFAILTGLAALSYLALLRFAEKRYREIES
jgi:ABC-2 type transport system permease protein